MSEVLRDLIVQLTLDSGSFSKDLKKVNTYVKEAEASFKAAGAGITNFDKTNAGRTARLATVQQQLAVYGKSAARYSTEISANDKKIKNYTTVLNGLQDKLYAIRGRQDAYNSSLITERANYNLLGSQIKSYENQYEGLGKRIEIVRNQKEQIFRDISTASASGNQQLVDSLSDEYISLQNQESILVSTQSEIGKSLESTRADYKRSGKTIEDYEDNLKTLNKLEKKVDGQVKSQKKTISGLETTQSSLRTGLAETNAEMAKLTKEQATLSNNWFPIAQGAETASKAFSSFGKVAEKLGKSMTKMVTTPIVTLAAYAVKQSINFESAMTSIRKTVDATDSEFEQFAKDIDEMAYETGVSQTEIAEVMATAGQLGIKNDYLTEFTRTMIDLGQASEDLTASDAASYLAKFANITNLDQSQFSNLGATITELGNNFATTEGEIVEMSYRIGAVATNYGFTQAEIMGVSATMASLGLNAQSAGSTMQRTLKKINEAAKTGTGNAKTFAELMGVTTKEFQTMWELDPAQTFNDIIIGMAKATQNGTDLTEIFGDLGISEVRMTDGLMRLANGSSVLTDAISTARSAWDENTALVDEANKRYNTLSNKLSGLKNKASAAARTFGDDMTPALKSIMEYASGLLDSFMNMDDATRSSVQGVLTFLAAIGPASLIIGKVSKAVGKFTGTIATMINGMLDVATTPGFSGNMFQAFVQGSNAAKVAVGGLAVSLAAVAAYLAYINSDTYKTKKAIQGLSDTADDWSEHSYNTLFDIDGLSALDISSDTFTSGEQSMQEWLDSVEEMWKATDDKTKKISNDTKKSYKETFKSLTATTKTQLKALQEEAVSNGYKDLGKQIGSAIKELDKMDSRINTLLNKNTLTDKETAELEQLVKRRQELIEQYNLGTDEDHGYNAIEDKVTDAEKRNQADNGQDLADAETYQEAISAASQGHDEIRDSLWEEYQTQRKLAELAGDTAKVDELDAKYQKDKAEADAQYYENVSKYANKLLQTGEYSDVQGTLSQLMQYTSDWLNATDQGEKATALENINAAVAGLDQDKLAEYTSLLQLMQQSGDAETQQTAADLLAPYESLKQYYDDNQGTFEALGNMFNTNEQQTYSILLDIQATDAASTWKSFIDNPKVNATVNVGYLAQQGAEKEIVDAFHEQCPDSEFNIPVTYDPQKFDITSAITNGGKAFTIRDGVIIPVTPEEASTIDASSLVVGTDENGQYTILIVPKVQDPITEADLYASENDNTGLASTLFNPLQSLLEQVQRAATTFGGFGGFFGTAKKNNVKQTLSYFKQGGKETELETFLQNVKSIADAGEQLTPQTVERLNDIATIFSFLQPVDDVDFQDTIKSWSDALGVSVDEFLATIKKLSGEDEDTQGEAEQVADTVTGASETVANAEEEAAQKVEDANNTDVDTSGAQSIVQQYQNILDEYANLDFNDPQAISKFVSDIQSLQSVLSGIELSDDENYFSILDAFGLNDFNFDSLGEVEQNLSYMLSYVNEIKDSLNETESTSASGTSTSLGQEITEIQGMLDSLMTNFDMNTFDQVIEKVTSLKTEINEMGQTPEGQQTLSDTLYNLFGDPNFTTDSLTQMLDSTLDFIRQFNNLGAEGNADTTTAGRNIGVAIIASAGNTISDTGAGILEGHLNTAVSGMTVDTSGASTIGTNIDAGIAGGISGSASIISMAAVAAVQSALAAAKAALGIHSPSRVFRDEVGKMMMKGLGVGVEEESVKQARVMKKAARYLTDQTEGALTSGSVVTNNNQRSYSSDTTLHVDTMVMQNDYDATALSRQLALASKRSRRGYGW